ncbi:MAG: inositol monophosphatase [Magnetospirillum sp.]|nr:inositol monophosphatase [Magnetospirillum sp.]
MTAHDWTAHLPIAEAAALLGGHHLRHRRAGWCQATWKGAHDIHVSADRAVEEIILGQLRAASRLPILSEEAGAESGVGEGAFWVVDPLDGSFNYAHGLPLCAISVALWQAWQPLLGVVYDFNRDELFSGMPGRGLTLNHAAVAPPEGDGRDILATGFPARSDHRAGAERMAEQVHAFRKVRLLGSAALSLAWVAAGRLDEYAEDGIMLWDVGGGLALVNAAGGSTAAEAPAGWLAPLSVRARRAGAPGQP